MDKVSIIIPVYYSEETLMDCYLDLKEKVLSKLPAYELILIDDDSGDNSYQICQEIVSLDSYAKAIKLSRNFGSHAACFAGMVEATGDCCTIKAADLQEPSVLILDMYHSWQAGNNVVLAVREDREEGFAQTAFANLYYGLVRRFISQAMPKQGFDCYLIDKKVVEALKLLDERNSAITLQILWAGFKTATVGYARLSRQKGKSRWTLQKKIKLVLDSFITFSHKPIRFVEIMGLLFSLGALGWGIMLIVLNLMGLIYVQGWTTLAVITLFSSGMIMLVLGVLGEYIWRILDVAQNRPVYFVEEREGTDCDT